MHHFGAFDQLTNKLSCTVELLSQVYKVLFNTPDFRREISPPLVDFECHPKGAIAILEELFQEILQGNSSYLWSRLGIERDNALLWRDSFRVELVLGF